LKGTKFLRVHLYKYFSIIYKKEAPFSECFFLKDLSRAFACRSACGLSVRFCSFLE
jgi:hypothetical protein